MAEVRYLKSIGGRMSLTEIRAALVIPLYYATCRNDRITSFCRGNSDFGGDPNKPDFLAKSVWLALEWSGLLNAYFDEQETDRLRPIAK